MTFTGPAGSDKITGKGGGFKQGTSPGADTE